MSFDKMLALVRRAWASKSILKAYPSITDARFIVLDMCECMDSRKITCFLHITTCNEYEMTRTVYDFKYITKALRCRPRHKRCV